MEAHMLDPWVIEEILKRERERQRKQEGEQPTVPADDPREIPEPDPRSETPKPGYEMPNRDGGTGHDTDNRGVDTFEIGGDIEIPKPEQTDTPPK